MTSAVLEGLIHSQDWERTAQARMRAFRGGPRYDVEHRVVRPNGDVRVVHSRVDVTKDESGRTRRADRARNRSNWSRADQRRMMRSLEDVY